MSRHTDKKTDKKTKNIKAERTKDKKTKRQKLFVKDAVSQEHKK